MGRSATITALSAVAASAVFLSLISGTAAGPLLAYFVQLPLLFCALAVGLGSAALASAAGFLVTIAIAGVVAGAVFAVVEVAPALLLARQALLWRRDAQGVTHWYPPGRIVGDLTGLGLVATLGMIAWLAMSHDSPQMIVEDALARLGGDVPADGWGSQIAGLLRGWAAWIPGFAAASWVVMTVLNGALAQVLAVRAAGARRPTPAIAELEVPAWWAIPLGLGLLLVLVAERWLAAAGATMVILSAVPYLFQGLGVVHAMARRHATSRLPMVAFYLLLLVFSYPLVILLVGLGLLEEVVGLRRRFA